VKFIEVEECREPPASASEIYGRLDEVMAADWRARMPEIAGLLVELRRDQRALRHFVSFQLRDGAWPTLEGAQSFVLARTDSMIVRTNLWFPPAARTANLDTYRKYLSIGEIHNHDFFFFTICLLGPGYTTQFYLDQAYSDSWDVGDKPMLEDLGVHALDDEKVLFVERDLDYHAQHWPQAFSATLNLIPRNVSGKHPVQYILDANDLSIKTVVSTADL
jgi:hypothetical protein